jgi:hypothetical protein
MDWREKEKMENAKKIEDAYQDNNGIWRWKSNNRVPFSDMLECWNLDESTFKKCVAARETDTSAFLQDYRKAMKNHVHSDEEMFEMRAAFGKNTTVVNVITGKKTRL